MRLSPKWKPWLKLVCLVALPAAMFLGIRAQRTEQTGILINGLDVGTVKSEYLYGNSVYLLAYNRDSKKLWSITSFDVSQWDINTLKKLSTRPLGPQHSHPPPSLPFLSADHQTLLTSDRDDRDCFYVKLWDIRTGKLERAIRVSGFMQYQRDAALSLNGVLATHNDAQEGQDARGLSYGEEIRIWNEKTGALSKLIQLPGTSAQGRATVSCLDLSRDGTLIAAGTQEGEIWVWDARSGQQLGCWKDGGADIVLSNTLTGSVSTTPGVYNVALSPDSKVLATASADDTVRLWAARTGKLLHILKTPTDQGHPPLVFSPNGKLLASAGTRTRSSYMGEADFNGRIWNVVTGTIYATLKGHQAPISAMAFSPNVAQLATGDVNGNIKVWQLR